VVEVAGCRLQIADYSLQVADYRLQIAGCNKTSGAKFQHKV